jgi:hypothetical protein
MRFVLHVLNFKAKGQDSSAYQTSVASGQISGCHGTTTNSPTLLLSGERLRLWLKRLARTLIRYTHETIQ